MFLRAAAIMTYWAKGEYFLIIFYLINLSFLSIAFLLEFYLTYFKTTNNTWLIPMTMLTPVVAIRL